MVSETTVAPKTTKKAVKAFDDIKGTSFPKVAKENNIPTRTFRNLEGVKNGFYIIAGVYSNGDNVKKLLKKYNRKGFEAGSIHVSDTGLHYLYLEYHTSGQHAIDACVDQLEGKYKDNVWIMQVEESEPVEETATIQATEGTASTNSTEELLLAEQKTATSISVDEVSYDMLTATSQANSTSIISNTPNKSKLIQKADSYFNKMWYAEAAELYEQALAKGEKNYSFDIIQKAADAHYFNTNMEKAHSWYEVLYEQYGKELSADNIFKYAHSLKGTGKYARAKKLMRLYNKKMNRAQEGELEDSNPTPNEIVLDNILGATQNFEIKNMGINTEYSDFSPMFLDSSKVVFASAKDSSFLNTRRYKWNNQPFLDLYVAKINKETQDLKGAIKFSKKINTKYHEASVTFSPDNTTMYFTRNNYGKKLKRDKNGVNHLKIYVSNKVDGEWTEAREVPFNSDTYSTGHPALSPDGKQLYFVSDMPGSIGQTDLFVVDVLENGNFSEPKNLGPEINTERREMFPFINDKKLYFSSDGHTGLGGLDVYEAAIDEEGGFMEVLNVGQPVNSNKDDFSYIVNEENQQGFFASNREGGKGDDDIYSFKRLIVEEVPENLNAIAGVVTEMVTGDIMPQALVELLDENGIKLKEVVTEEDGSFVFEDLDSSTKYILKTTKGEYFEDNREVTTKENELVNVDVNLRRLEEMIALEDGIKKLKTEMIFFDFDKSYIRKDAAAELDKLVEVMTEYPDMVIKIESHTDSRGSNVYNKYLSEKRAKSTRDYIISQGIDASRIESAKGYGEEQLLNNCNGRIRCTEEEHYRNRRSEFIIVDM
ncbi:OmpA family protein [Flavobacteriaceae bacterium TP-CH-4]|uniref:OmpA family protein n=2 Tax=Pelagihabitans pacificus TaxID=2696054 RepID=A0A967AYU6_9FLAO|nr:OmpA family protein [Pelagihabitans pacificus]